MANNRYKILVLSDLKKSTSTTLKSAISLAKMINGDIEFFYVKKPTEIIAKDNQLSAIRTINGAYKITEKKIKNLTNTFIKDYGIAINYTFSFGNVKNEIENCIKEQNPDIIVLGKRKSKPLNLIGDNITQFVLDKHHGTIMITAEENTLEPNEHLSLGLLNGVDYTSHIEFAKNLLEHTQKPLKLFKIVQGSSSYKEIHTPTDEKTIEYAFEQNDNTIKNLSKYLLKNNINLLCVDRTKKSSDSGVIQIKQDVKDIITKLNISLLLTGK